MRIRTFIWIFLLALLVNSCGIPTLTSTDDSQTPASLSGPETGFPPTSIPNANASYSQNIRFERFSLEEGLSQSVVTSILQDRKGFLWVGTEDGLNRYDGYNFTVYKPDSTNPTSLSDRWITALAED